MARRRTLVHQLVDECEALQALLEIDEELAATARAGGCPLCQGRLDGSDYPRKPRGGPASLGSEYERRRSFCCAVAGCRKRMTPPSVRFLGRKVYLGAVVVLASVLRQGPTPWRVRQLRERIGVSERTLTRWWVWWREAFVETAFWRVARSRFERPVARGLLPLSLLERFAGGGFAQLVNTLRFISPLTTSSAGAIGEACP